MSSSRQRKTISVSSFVPTTKKEYIVNVKCPGCGQQERMFFSQTRRNDGLIGHIFNRSCDTKRQPMSLIAWHNFKLQFLGFGPDEWTVTKRPGGWKYEHQETGKNTMGPGEILKLLDSKEIIPSVTPWNPEIETVASRKQIWTKKVIFVDVAVRKTKQQKSFVQQPNRPVNYKSADARYPTYMQPGKEVMALYVQDNYFYRALIVEHVITGIKVSWDDGTGTDLIKERDIDTDIRQITEKEEEQDRKKKEKLELKQQQTIKKKQKEQDQKRKQLEKIEKQQEQEKQDIEEEQEKQKMKQRQEKKMQKQNQKKVQQLKQILKTI